MTTSKTTPAAVKPSASLKSVNGLAVKKTFQPIYESISLVLKSNPHMTLKKYIEDYADDYVATKVTRQSVNRILDAAGSVVAIFDTYIQQWVALKGEKSEVFGTTNGKLNSRCNASQAQYSRRFTVKAQKLQEALDAFMAGSTDAEKYKEIVSKIEDGSKNPKGEKIENGFDTEDEVLKYLADSGVSLPQAAG